MGDYDTTFYQYFKTTDIGKKYEELKNELSDKKYDKYFRERVKIADRESKYLELHTIQIKEVLDMIKKYIPNKPFTFLDICFAPGAYTRYILENYPKATGRGITLDPAQGGLNPIVEKSDKFDYTYMNILTDYNENDRNKYDLVVIGCQDMTFGKNKKDTETSTASYNKSLVFKSFYYALSSCKEHGSIMFKYTVKKLNEFSQFIYMLRKIAGITFAKSVSVYGHRSTLFILAYNIKKTTNEYEQFVEYIKTFEYITNKFSKEYYHELMKELTPILEIQMEAIEKFKENPYHSHYEDL